MSSEVECPRCHQKTKRLINNLCAECNDKAQSITDFFPKIHTKEKEGEETDFKSFSLNDLENYKEIMFKSIFKLLDLVPETIDIDSEEPEPENLKIFTLKRTYNNQLYDIITIIPAKRNTYIIKTKQGSFAVNKDNLLAVLRRFHEEHPFDLPPEILINLILDD